MESGEKISITLWRFRRTIKKETIISNCSKQTEAHIGNAQVYEGRKQKPRRTTLDQNLTRLAALFPLLGRNYVYGNFNGEIYQEACGFVSTSCVAMRLFKKIMAIVCDSFAAAATFRKKICGSAALGINLRLTFTLTLNSYPHPYSCPYPNRNRNPHPIHG